MATGQVEIAVRGPFSLAQSVEFLAGFKAIGAPRADDGVFRLAFVDDGGEPAAIAAREDGGRVVVSYRSGLPAERVAAHAARILSLDVDGAGFPAVGERDPVVAELQRTFPGRRPVCYGSPFEAAIWALLSQRTSMRHAAAIRERIVEVLGTPVEVDGVALRAFPAPERVAALEVPPGVSLAKVERARAVARAALAGELDAETLRSIPVEEALERLQDLPGIGPFSAELILARGAGHPDALPLSAPRFASSVAEAYGLPSPPGRAEIEALGERWRPFRSWVAFLLRNVSDRARSARGRA